MEHMSRVTRTSLHVPEEVLQVGPLLIDPAWKTTIHNASDAVGTATLSVEFDESLMRFAIVSVLVERSGEGAELTGNALRDMRISEALQVAALHHIWVKGTGRMVTKLNGVNYVDAGEALRLLPEVTGRTTDEDATNATYAYRIAQVSGAPVLKTISEALNTSQSTAKRLVARARELGYIDG